MFETLFALDPKMSAAFRQLEAERQAKAKAQAQSPQTKSLDRTAKASTAALVLVYGCLGAAVLLAFTRK